MDPTNQAVLSTLRSVLIYAGAIVTMKGWASSEMVSEGIGVLMAVIPAAWGIIQKYQADHSTKVRETSAVQAGVVASRAGAAPSLANSIDHADAKELIQTFAPAPAKP